MPLPSPNVVHSESRLATLARYGILDSVSEPAFEDIVALARSICDAPVALISFVETDRQWFKARSGVDICETPLEQSVCAHAITQGSMLVIPDLTQDERTRDNTLVTGAPFIRFYAGALLEAPNGEMLGSLCVLDYAPRAAGLTAKQTDALQILANQVVHLLEMRVSLGARDEALDRERQSSRSNLDRAVRSERIGELIRRESDRSRAAQEAGQIGIFELDTQTNLTRVSSEFCRIFGLPVRAAYPASEIESLILPEDKAEASSAATRRNKSAPARVEYRIRRANDGTIRWISRRAEFRDRADDRPANFSGTVHDVTERKLEELRQTALVALGDRLRDAKTVKDIAAIGTRVLGETLVASRSVYSTIDLRADMLVVEGEWTAPGVKSVMGRYPLSAVRRTSERLKSGQAVVVNDVDATDWLSGDRETYAPNSIASQIQVPLMLGGALAGLLSVHNAQPREWSPSEVAFAQAVADRTYAAAARLIAEEQQHLLNHELSHRMKNTLAMVLAIATQTLKGVSEKGAVKAFTDRLMALSKAHDILLHQHWTEARITTAVAGVLSLHVDAARFDMNGSDINLGSRGIMSLTMLLHELATNAVKYGAWSGPSGRVSVTWVTEGTSDPTFHLTWTETGGPTPREPGRRGFGSRLISAGLVGTSEALLRYQPSGLVAEFKAPLSLMTAN